MILPHVARDAPELAAFDATTRRVFTVVYDMVDGYASEPPVWQVTRYLVAAGSLLFGAESRLALEPGWRAVASLAHISLPSTGLPSPGPGEIHPGEATLVWHGYADVAQMKLSLGDFIVHMEKAGLGRPSTYARHAQNLLKTGLIEGSNDVRLSRRGHKLLAGIRASSAARFNAAFCRKFLNDLDAIESGALSTAKALAGWLSVEHANHATDWLDTLQIEGDLAALTYEAREGADRSTIFWPAGALPAELDPEQMLAQDSPERQIRRELNEDAADCSMDWLQMSVAERRDKRIDLCAEREGIAAGEWQKKYQFDLLQRWLVGWVIDEV
ncbi:DNA topoisomerase [Paraburkholderia bonniea]|uniref:DNA topoisomerase n=1 Tax=Paraburkholderia bonniea TaxID=2152891 RepID=UPI002572308F|nr:DNA topoisomerase [Paraburkholderia bonniea]WJF90391.1 DNA topoisomerase [Paraburkholderia bonniea]WJF93706.1 DNA topoisomerase [Paraburkholderia bonniea]